MTRSPQVRQRRRAPRLATRLAGSLAGRVAHPVTVLDLSLTGCLVQCGRLLDHGAILALDVDVEGQPLCARVRVAESYVDGSVPAEPSGGFLAGLEFLGLPPRESDRLRRFLDEERRRRQRADAPPR